MNPHRLFFQKISGKKTAVVLSAAFMVLALALSASGCGSSDSGSSAQTNTSGNQAGGLSRPAPGTVEMLDGRNDITGGQDISQVPSWIDINWASVARDGDKLVFTMDFAGALPDNLQPGMASEWGFMLDASMGGTPDWVIYGSISKSDGWTEGVYNPKTKVRLADSQFPGTFTHSGTKLVLTVNAADVGSPQNFKWFAYSNYFIKPTGSASQQAGDRVPDNGQPDNSANWLPYP